MVIMTSIIIRVVESSFRGGGGMKKGERKDIKTKETQKKTYVGEMGSKKNDFVLFW